MLDSCADRMAEALDKFQVPQIAAGFFWPAGHKGDRQFFVVFFKEFVWKMFDHGRFRTSRSSVLSVVHCGTF
jgi:hypothetical protein